MVCAYIDEVNVITKNDYMDHLKYLDRVIQRPIKAGIKLNLENYFFVLTETEYLGLGVSNNRVRPLSSKV